MNINIFQRVHLRTIAINTLVFVLFTFTEIISFLQQADLTADCSDMMCFQSFFGLGMSDTRIHRHIIIGNVFIRR